jgi:hypothetical protein
MKEQRQKALQELQEKAIAELDFTNPAILSAAETLIMYLSIRPSFEDWRSWFLSKNVSSQYVARQVLWRKVFDFQRFSDPLMGLKYGWNPDPTLETESFSLEKEAFETLFVTVRKIELPPPANSNIVLDGTEWLLRMPGYFHDQIVIWNAEPKELTSWAKRTLMQ